MTKIDALTEFGVLFGADPNEYKSAADSSSIQASCCFRLAGVPRWVILRL
jgi:hypothetical protein